MDDVLRSEVLVWPVQLLDVSPVSDGAAAMVFVDGDIARRYTDTPYGLRELDGPSITPLGPTGNLRIPDTLRTQLGWPTGWQG